MKKSLLITLSALSLSLVSCNFYDSNFSSSSPEEILSYNVQVHQNGKGKVTGATGELLAGSEVTFYAIPDEGWKFVSYSMGNQVLSTEQSYTLIVDKDYDITVNFEQIVNYKFEVEIVGSGTVTGAQNGAYEEGTEITLTAAAEEGHHFVGYYIDDTKISDQPIYTLKLESDIKVIARFEENAKEYTFSYTVIGSGAVSGTAVGTYIEGAEITLTAKADEGNEFVGFFEDDVIISSESTYTFALNKNTSIEVRFKKIIDTEGYRYETFSHKFIQTDFDGTGYDTVAGSTTINGLSFSFDKFTYLGQSSDGIQIGSKRQPQTTPWNLRVNFNEEVILTSFSISGINSAGTDMTLTGDQFTKRETLLNPAYQIYTYEEMAISTSYLNIALSASSKAFYMDVITFTCMVKENSELHFSTDELSVQPAVPGANGVPMTKHTLITKEEYYTDVNLELAGEELKTALHNKISVLDKYSYGDDTNILLYTDANIENGAYLYGIYDGDDIAAINSGIWNKEHVWACSQMGLGGDKRPSSSTTNRSSDLHNLRVCCQSTNGLHGNKFFDNENSAVAYFPNVSGTPNPSHNFRGDHRGDVARILFYMATTYSDEGLHLDDLLNTTDDFSMGKLSTLISWNRLDPIDDFEIQRNNRIYEYQGNRNPFIDYPELVDKIFA